MMTASALDFEERGDSWALVRVSDGQRSEMMLSDEDVLTMFQSIPSMTTRILAKLSRTGVTPRATTPVTRVDVETDLHKSDVVLTMYALNGDQMSFVLPPQVASFLVERLIECVAEIEASPTRQ
jgi:hypothetical protein